MNNENISYNDAIKVSVIIPTFNSEQTIQRAVNSVLSQTFTGFEILICDDCSVDNTVNLALKYSSNDQRIKVLCLDRNQGAGASRNLGLQSARGKYIAFLDSDDEWAPEKLQKQVELMDAQPDDVGVCFCGAQIIKNDEFSKKVVYRPNRKLEIDTYKKMALGKIPFLTPVLFFRRICLEKSGLMVPEMRRNQDGEFLLRLFMFYKLVVIPEAYATIHLVVSAKKKKVFFRTKSAFPFWERHSKVIKSDLGFFNSVLFISFRRTDLFCLAIRERFWSEAALCFWERIMSCPVLFPREIISILRSIGSLFLRIN